MGDFAHCMIEAKEATKDNAHVAVLFNYRNAVECAGYVTGTAPVLLEAVLYASKLRKERDRLAIAEWGSEVINKIDPPSQLTNIIRGEIDKLKIGGK